jgi:hypothetical protein
MHRYTGENSAIHSLQAVVLGAELFNRAGLFGKGAAEDGVGAWQTPILLGVLVHDMGEILGELSSLAQRSVNKSLREQPEVERDKSEVERAET